MDDLISRQAAIDAMYMGCYLTPKDRGDLVKALEQLPTIDAISVKPGEWIIEHFYTDGNGVDIPFCTACGKPNKFPQKTAFCPNCGAKMDGERRT